jgi:hypothetical protein
MKHTAPCVPAALEATTHRKHTHKHTGHCVYQLPWRQPLTRSTQPPVCTSCLGGNNSQEAHTQAHRPLCVRAALEATTHKKHTHTSTQPPMCNSCLGGNQSQKAHKPLCLPTALEATNHRKHTQAHKPLCLPTALEAATHRKHTQAHRPLCVPAALEATTHRKHIHKHTIPCVYQLPWRQPLTGSTQPLVFTIFLGGNHSQKAHTSTRPPVCTSCLGGNHSQEAHTQAHKPLCVPAALEATTHRKHTAPCVYHLPWRQPLTRSTQPPVCTSCLGCNHSQKAHTSTRAPVCTS